MSSGYKPCARESAAIKRLQRRAAEASPAPRLKVDGEKLKVAHDDPGVGYRLLAEALGTSDADFVNGLLRQLANLARRRGRGQIDDADLNFLIAVIKDVKPGDQLEAMLAAQMAVVHKLAMAVAQRLGDVEFNRATGQRAQRRHQAHAHVRSSARGAQTLPHGRRAKGHGAACQCERRGPSHRRQCTTRAATATRQPDAAPPAAHASCAGANARFRRRGKPRPPFAEGDARMAGNHPRNTEPMLNSQRCGAKTRSGAACRPAAVSGKARSACMAARLDPARRSETPNALTSGFFTREAIAECKAIRELVRDLRKWAGKID